MRMEDKNRGGLEMRLLSYICIVIYSYIGIKKLLQVTKDFCYSGNYKLN